MGVHGAPLLVHRLDHGDLGAEGLGVELGRLGRAVDAEIDHDAALHWGHGRLGLGRRLGVSHVFPPARQSEDVSPLL